MKNKGEMTTLAAISGALIALALILGNLIGQIQTLKNANTAIGSVTGGNEYIATSTAANNFYGALITADQVIFTGQGTLGSLVILGANTGILNFYDATTTNVNARTGQKASSTILIASIPASMAAGTYTFDVRVIDGLLVDLVSGNMPTSTLTWRR